MGFDKYGIRLLLNSIKQDVDYSKVITIGRQRLFVQKEEIERLLIKTGIINQKGEVSFERNDFAERFFQLLGSKIADSIDASGYENATLLHDMNIPISKNLHSAYSVVVDGGSLEHIFNFPVAIKNCMDLIQEGGHFIGITPANNFFGHGFYQFSPELYYRIFSNENGFRIKKIYLYVVNKKESYYEVLDPFFVKQRIEMVNSYPTYLFVIAQKYQKKEPFKLFPQQSDYEQFIWKGLSDQKRPKRFNLIKLVKTLIPKFVKNAILKQYFATGICNSNFVKRVNL